MCHSHRDGTCGGCHHAISRRDFLKGTGTALATLRGLASAMAVAGETQDQRVRVGLVFL